MKKYRSILAIALAVSMMTTLVAPGVMAAEFAEEGYAEEGYVEEGYAEEGYAEEGYAEEDFEFVANGNEEEVAAGAEESDIFIDEVIDEASYHSTALEDYISDDFDEELEETETFIEDEADSAFVMESAVETAEVDGAAEVDELGETVPADSDFQTESAAHADGSLNITYDANGGVFNDNSTEWHFDASDGETIYRSGVPFESCIRSGYYLRGWATTPDASVPDVIAADENYFYENDPAEYVLTQDMTIYAVWMPSVTFTVVTNSGEFPDCMSAHQTQVPLGETVNLFRFQWYSREGYDFLGWTRSEAAFYAEEFIATEPITVYGVWRSQNPMEVIGGYVLDGEDNPDRYMAIFPRDSKLTLYANPSDETKDVTYQWYRKAYGATYMRAIDGATEASYTVAETPIFDEYCCVIRDVGSTDAASCEFTVGIETPVRVFLKWEADESSDEYIILEVNATDPTGLTNPSTYTYEWRWQAEDYEEYDFDASDSETDEVHSTIEHTYLNDSHSRVRVKVSSDVRNFGVRANTAYYGRAGICIRNPQQSYTVIYDANGGRFSDDLTQIMITYERNEPATLVYSDTPYDDVTLTGKMCLGWSLDPNATSPDAIDISYLASVERTSNFFKVTDNTTLYAVWADGCEVTFDAGDGMLSILEQCDGYDNNIEPWTNKRKLPVETPILLYAYTGLPNDEAYEFAGWQMDDGTIVDRTTPITLTGDVTLHAVYTKKCAVKIVAGDGGILYDYNESSQGRASLDLLLAPGSKLTTFRTYPLDLEVQPNYIFVGWTDQENGTEALKPESEVQDGVTYYALYKACTHEWYDYVSVNPSCTKVGTRVYYCEICGAAKYEEISATGHSYGSYTTTKAATAIAEGSKYRICKTCKYKQTVAIAKLTPYAKLSVSSLKLQVGQSYSKVTVTMQKGDYIKSWKSRNAAIATVKGSYGTTTTNKVVACTVKGVKAGSATITVTLASGKTGTFKVAVQTTPVATTALKLTSPKPTNTAGTLGAVTIVKNNYYAIKYTRAPITANDKVEFYSYDKTVATVSSTGVIKGVANGSTKIRVKAGSKYAFVTVTVKSSIAVNATELPLQKKQVFKGFKVTMQKGDYVTAWKSSNTAVVKVTGGTGATNGTAGTCTITAMSPAAAASTAYISVTLHSGLKKVVKVTVQTAKVATNALTLTAPSNGKLKLYTSYSYQIKYKRLPITAQDTVKFTTSNSDIGMLSSTGFIQSAFPGTCTITVKSGTKVQKIALTVEDPGWGIG